MKPVKFLTLCLAPFFILSGCKNTDSKEINFTYIQTQTSSRQIAVRPVNNLKDYKSALVIFGYDFNDSQVVQNLKNLFQKDFGFQPDSSDLITTLVYPDDFKRGAKGYASELSSILNDITKDYSAVIVLGAPENTHIALARHQDFWNGAVPYPVVSLFPQDDVLGLESTCDFVLDIGQSSSMNNSLDAENAEEAAAYLFQAPEITEKVISYLLDYQGCFTKDNSLSVHMQQLLKGTPFHHYSDPETGLQSINHFVTN